MLPTRPQQERPGRRTAIRFLGGAAFAAVAALAGRATASVAAWTVSPGPAQAEQQGDLLTLANRALRAAWTVKEGHLRPAGARNLLAGADLPRSREAFVLVLRDGHTLAASSLEIVGRPERQDREALPGAVRTAERFASHGFL